MIMDTKKFNKEIQALKLLSGLGGGLHPLVQQQIKQRLVAAASSPLQPQAPVSRLVRQERSIMFMRYLIATVLGIVVLGGTVYGSNNAKPGDWLFFVKKTKETVELSLTTSTEAKAKLQTRFANERLKELEQINNQTQVNIQAQTRAETEVSTAINVLNEVRAKLETKGNAAAAAAVGETVEKLQEKFSQQKREFKTQALIQKTDQGFTAKLNGQIYQISNPVDLSAFVGTTAQIKGRLDKNNKLMLGELNLGKLQAKLNGSQIKVEIEDVVLQQGLEGFKVITANLTFNISADQQLTAALSANLNQQVNVEGILNGHNLILTNVEFKNETQMETPTQRRNNGHGGQESNQELNENSASTSQLLKQTQTGQTVELEGTLKQNLGRVEIQTDGKVYILVGTGLNQFLGQRVKVVGTLGAGIFTVTKVEPKDNSNPSDESGN